MEQNQQVTEVEEVEEVETVDTATPSAPAAASGTELVTESLVEEVSIDGMCGVY